MQFEERLAKEYGIIRQLRDAVHNPSVAGPVTLHGALPMRPVDVLKVLDISEYELIDLLVSGQLPYPELIAPGKVAWRRDEIEVVSSFARRFGRDLT